MDLDSVQVGSVPYLDGVRLLSTGPDRAAPSATLSRRLTIVNDHAENAGCVPLSSATPSGVIV